MKLWAAALFAASLLLLLPGCVAPPQNCGAIKTRCEAIQINSAQSIIDRQKCYSQWEGCLRADAMALARNGDYALARAKCIELDQNFFEEQGSTNAEYMCKTDVALAAALRGDRRDAVDECKSIRSSNALSGTEMNYCLARVAEALHDPNVCDEMFDITGLGIWPGAAVAACKASAQPPQASACTLATALLAFAMLFVAFPRKG